MGHFHYQLESIRGGKPVVEMLRPIRFEVLADHLDSVKQSKQLGWVRRWKGADPLDKGASDEPQEAAGEGVPGQGSQISGCTGDLLPDSRTQLGEVSGGFLGPGCMLDHPLPLRFGPQYRIAQSFPERWGN